MCVGEGEREVSVCGEMCVWERVCVGEGDRVCVGESVWERRESESGREIESECGRGREESVWGRE